MSNTMEFIEKAIKVSVAELEAILRPITGSTTCHVIYIVDDNRSSQVKSSGASGDLLLTAIVGFID